MNILLLVSTLAAQPADDIVVTASRTPVPSEQSAASSTVLHEDAKDALAFPALPDLLRLTPGLSVASTGPRGAQTQVRIRGAEANHTLLFVDGIRFNDPAAGNEARFELLTADSLSRVEVVRGPHSALWGSEALGGVVAVESADPFEISGLEASAEYGSLDSARLYGRYALRTGDVGVMASAGWQRSDGIDSFGSGGERDGFDILAASLQMEARPSGPFRFGLTGHYVEGDSQYDGFDPLTFQRADTLDETANRIAAGRLWAAADWGDWNAEAHAAYLDSANRNSLAGAPINSTSGDRLTLGGQLSRRLGSHRLTAAIEHEAEDFRARDSGYFRGSDQDRVRHLTAFAAEWRAEWSEAIVTDVAARHDAFSAFADATTFRASLFVRPIDRLAFHAAYGEGIAQPTFYDLFGFFPGSFSGNSDLKPERSKSWEAGLAWRGESFEIGATYFSDRLTDEIVDVFDPATFLSSTVNADGRSRREGIELTGTWRPAPWLNLTANYTWLDADEQRIAGTALVREVRRPRSSANLAGYGTAGRFRWGASLAYVGARTDTDFDLFPAATVRMDDYALASINLAYRLWGGIEIYARAENLFDADYQDVVGYNTAGRTVYAGLRVAFGD